MRLRRSVLVVGAALVGSVLLATSAWAWCSPYIDHSSFVEVQPNRAVSSTEVSVRVGNWAAGPIEVHWATASGPLLGRSYVPWDYAQLSIPVVIPESAAPGSYALVVVHGASQMSTAFVVTPPAASTASDSSPDPAATSDISTTGPTLAAAPAPVEKSSSSGAQAGSATPATQASVAPAAGPAGAGVATVVIPDGPAIAVAPGVAAAAKVVAPRTAARPATGTPARADAADEPGVREVVAPSPLSVDADLWSGYRGTAPGPSLTALPDAGGRDLPAPLLGAVVLVLGIGTVFGGFAVAEVRRRTALSRTP